MKVNRLFFALAMFAALSVPCESMAQKKSSIQILQRKDSTFFKTEEARRVGDQLLLYQRNTGGWPKNIDMVTPLTPEQQDSVKLKKTIMDDSTIDNKATSLQMTYLARLYQQTKDSCYRAAFNKGLEFLFSGQYENGGWPQFWPKNRDYQIHITYNDNAIINVLKMFRDIIKDREPYNGGLVDEAMRKKTKQSFDKAIDCILATQIVVDGQPTVWCQQHDSKTLLPAKARAYELPSFSTLESANIVFLLMQISHPNERIIRAVNGAMKWFDEHKIVGYRLEKFEANGKKDIRLVKDETAKPIWARYYDLEEGKPFVCDRDGVPKRSLEEIGYERRNGYGWYNDQAEALYARYETWATKNKVKDRVTFSQVFIYAPNERAGLHIAEQTNGGWQEIGQLCQSDYGTWGAEKRMYHPSVARANDGTWRLVFQINDKSPMFAAAYSRDLVTWRPQDYPIMTTKQCMAPVVFPNESGTFDIYYKTKGGDKRWVSASNDFRKFSKDEPSQIDKAAWTRDTATIAGTLQEGCLFEISLAELATIKNHFAKLAEDARISSERMHDDAKNPALPTQPVSATLTVSTQEKAISDKLIGIFFEDISYAADGGLYAELIQNRDFEYTSKDQKGWNATTAWSSEKPINVVQVDPLSENNPHYAVLGDEIIWNEGWDGIAVKKGSKYDFSMFVRNIEGKKNFTILLQDEAGNTIGKASLKTQGAAWKRYDAVLKATKTCGKARLAVVGLKETKAGIDMVSLFPQETFMNRKNGLRKDLAETIAALKPKFVRFPGGCMSHGQGLENIYHWNHTVGPLEQRKPDFNIWHYHQTRGLGFYEYFQFCEDIGAEPLPVLAAGVPCQNSANNRQGIGGQQGGIPMEQMGAYIQELLDLIDWANGDPATSKWAKMRADAGHPAPFNLKYIGIGNEDIIGTVFEERYEMICKAIRKKYPEIKICGTVGPFHTPSADYLEGWDFTKKHPDLQYMVDEHYYESTGWFMHHRNYYDGYDRNMPKVYLGEYAASTKAKRPNVETALAEALYLTDVERNGDIVEMSSYAPMLCKDGHSNWNPDMIYFSNTEVRPTPAYETQRLFSVYSGDRYISTNLTINSGEAYSHRVGASLVRDSKTGKRYLKLVNALPVALTINVSGMTIPAGAKTEGFGGQPEDQKVEIKHGEAAGNTITLSPYTFSVIAL